MDNFLKNYYHGAYRFEETDDGYLLGIQYTKEQMEYLKFNDFFYVRTIYGNSKTLEFITDATEVSFDYKFKENGGDTIELAVDGIIEEVRYGKDMQKNGTVTFALKEGKKEVCIYLPADNVLYVKNLKINAKAVPVEKKTKVLWMGDSITQGYGPFRSAETYVSVANRILKYEVINQGIGGYYYDKNVLMEMEGYTPDKIILAHGTNQCLSDTAVKDTAKYYARLSELYPDIPVLTITPLWRGDFNEENTNRFIGFCNNIKEISLSYPNVKVVDGFKLMHHSKEYYMEDWLHPNALGCESYGRNLADEIIKMKF